MGLQKLVLVSPVLATHSQAQSKDLFEYLGKFGNKISNMQYMAYHKSED